MKKTLFGLLFIYGFLLNTWSLPDSSIVACGDEKVLIIDHEASNGTEVRITWKWTASDDGALPEDYQRLMGTIDDCKAVDSGSKILLTSSGGGVVLVDRKSGKSLFHARVPNAHSAEYLPGGRIAVALSTAEKGNAVELYDVNRPEDVLFRDSLHSGHGVVWIDKLQTLFALGGSELRAYNLENRESPAPRLSLVESWKIPGEGGHDLFGVSEKRLILTTVDNVWNFDIEKEDFSVFQPLAGVANVKSVNFDQNSGRLIYTKAEESWWTENIYLRNPDKVISIPGLRLYKVRMFSGRKNLAE